MEGLNDIIKYMAGSIWGSPYISRAYEMDNFFRCRCGYCGTTRILFKEDVFSEKNGCLEEVYFDVYMTLCGCGKVIYYVEWHNDDKRFKSRQQKLINTCDEILKELS